MRCLSIQSAIFGNGMGRASGPLFFHEEQAFRQLRLRILTAIPPIAMLLMVIWQVGLGHSIGKTPMSSAGLVGWTIFVCLLYLRLVTVKLVTEVGPGEARIALRGLWRTSRIDLATVSLVDIVTFDPVRDWGGFGIRSNKRGRAYIAGGNHGVQLTFAKGKTILIESQAAGELASAIREAIRCPNY